MGANSWTWADYDYLYNHYALEDSVDTAKNLNRAVLNIESKANKLGLTKYQPPTDEELKSSSYFGKVLGSAMIFLLPNRSLPELEVLMSCKK